MGLFGLFGGWHDAHCCRELPLYCIKALRAVLKSVGLKIAAETGDIRDDLTYLTGGGGARPGARPVFNLVITYL